MKIIIQNISGKVTADSLAAIFARYGHVASAVILPEQKSDVNRKTALVFMPDEAKASNAAGQLDGCVVDGQVLSVKMAQPKPVPSQPSLYKRFYLFLSPTGKTTFFK